MSWTKITLEKRGEFLRIKYHRTNGTKLTNCQLSGSLITTSNREIIEANDAERSTRIWLQRKPANDGWICNVTFGAGARGCTRKEPPSELLLLDKYNRQTRLTQLYCCIPLTDLHSTHNTIRYDTIRFVSFRSLSSWTILDAICL